MPIINGEKYACQSCIKGHRVSGCQHTDRELQHINPKGRPVKQCDHCRNSRKTKSHHARCECGHKKDKAKHEDGESGQHFDAADNVTISNLSAAHDDGCSCHSGSKCICGTKKDHGLKLETSAKTKPRLTTTHSESTLTVFANGHHKPCHRLNNSAHTSGLPYKIPRHHTLHGTSGSAHHSNESVNNFYDLPTQQRSMDCLGMLDTNGIGTYGAGPLSGDSQPLTPIGSAADAEEYKFDPFRPVFSTTQAPASGLASGSNSPVDVLSSQPQWPWAASIGPQVPQYGLDNLSTSPTVDFMPQDNDWAIPSAGLQPSWSATDLPLHPEKFADPTNQPISHCGDSTRASVPGLSTSSSQSEIGEPNFFGDLDFNKAAQAPVAEPVWEDALHYRRNRSYRGLSNASTPPDLRHAPTSVPTPDNPSRNSLDLEFIRRTSPPMAVELENYLPQRPFSNPLMETVSQEKMASPPTSNPFMPTSDYAILEGQPRPMGVSSSIEGNGSGLSPWMSYLNPAEVTSNSFADLETTPDVTSFTYNDNFS